MPRLPSEKMERYCIQRASGMNKTDSHVAAGYKARDRDSHGARSRKLEAKPHIQARIVELTSVVNETAMKAVSMDKEAVLANLRRTYEEAYERGKFGDSTRALELYGKQLGMFSQAIDIRHFDHHLDGLDAEGVRDMLKSIIPQIGVRMIDMTDEETREYIIAVAPRVGLRVVEAEGRRADGERAASAQDPGLPPLQ
jgi:hypothetical protein